MTTNHQDQSDLLLYIQKAYTCFARGNIEGAIAHFDAAINRYLDCADIYTERARFRQQKLGDYQGAIEDYNTAMNLAPENTIYHVFPTITNGS